MVYICICVYINGTFGSNIFLVGVSIIQNFSISIEFFVLKSPLSFTDFTVSFNLYQL